METAKIIDLSLYSEFLLIYLAIYIFINRSKTELSSKLFLVIVATLLVNNFLEAASWIPDGINSSGARFANILINSLLLAFNSLPAVAWVVYADYKIFNNIQMIKKRIFLYMIPFYISVVLVIANLFTDVVFVIDKQNHYSRNIGVYIIASLTYILVFILYIISKRYKKLIDGRVLESIFWFMLIPVCAGIMQVIYFGIPLIWPAFTLSTIIVLNLVENDVFLKDHLTGLSTRGQLEKRLKYMLKRNNNFSVIMIDMNDFKIINDKFGHNEGDRALITAASILRHEVKNQDMVCRYGGDEFMILIDSEHEKAFEHAMFRIQEALNTYNLKNIKPYRLSMSYGGVFVNSTSEKSLHDILTEVDELMYADKEIRKS